MLHHFVHDVNIAISVRIHSTVSPYYLSGKAEFMMDVLIKITNIRWMRSLIPASEVKRSLSCITRDVWISTIVQQELSHWPVSVESSKVEGCETSPT